MKIIDRTNFRNNLAEHLKQVTETKQPIVVLGSHGAKHVVIELEEYELLREAIESKTLKGNE